jgi:3-hydroxyisobutyrate dehydrogenase-like beta-hydroxyacid dehydrogenase
MKIGVIGLGKMGTGMASNLIKAGHEVTVFNRTASAMEPVVALGARGASSVAEACGGDAVITMLANDAAVEAVGFAKDGILSALPKGGIHISSSTISAALSARLTEAHQEHGHGYVAAPVFGRPEAAAAGKLFVVAAGAEATIADCQPLFDAIGQKTFVVGQTPTAANIVKLSGNFLIASVIEALGEAMALVGKAGIDQRQYLDLLTSTLFDAPVYRTYGTLIVEKKFSPAGFAAPLGLKDINLALSAAQDLKVPMPLASLLHDRFLALLAQGGEALDWSAIAALAARDAGDPSASVP